MNRLDLINLIQNLKDEESIAFYLSDEKISNRFDRENVNQYKKGDHLTDISYSLYSYIANSIFYKAQGEEKAKVGYSSFDNQWEEIISKALFETKDNIKAIKDEAMLLLSDFLFSKKQVTLPDMVFRFLPLSIYKEMNLYPGEAKKIYRCSLKKKEVLLNQVTLFTRSLYHSFLNRKNIDPEKILPDRDDLSNGIFSYEGKELLIPTWQNAFTLDSFRKVAQNGIFRISSSLPLDDISIISVIYLSKDIVVKYSL